MTKENNFVKELIKFIGQDVEVAVITSDGFKTFKGTCKALDYKSMNVVLMTNEEKIVLKNFLSISRKRDYKGGQK
jgi:small nuclear ribonucleoprotein (snRNP)-like protein